MPPQSTETHGRRGNERGENTDAPSRAIRAISTLAGYGKGAPAVLTGGALLVRAARAGRRGRRVGQVLIGGALLGLGIRQWQSSGKPAAADATADDGSEAGTDAGGSKVSDDARAALERHDVMHQAETNPRGTSEEPEVETVTDPDDGEVRFTDQQDDETGPKPHLDQEDPIDPRYQDDDDGAIEIDLSEATMADEASEATGPDDEQAQPAQTEDTEPEPSPPEDVSHTEADVPDGSDAADVDVGTAGNGSEDDETDEGATVREKWVEGDDSDS